MNASEFLAMVDDRLSDGRHYPTLDDYSAALEEIRRREGRQQSSAATLWDRMKAQGMDRSVAHDAAYRVRPMSPVSDPPHLVYTIEMRTAGASWHRTDLSFKTREAAARYADQIRRVQPHVEVRIV